MARIDLDEISFIGSDLRRPSSVLSTASGHLYAANWSGGVSRLNPDGSHHVILATGAEWLRPNDIALRQSGTFLIAHLGDIEGGVYELDTSGNLTEVLLAVDGIRLPPTNSVVEDLSGRVWASIGTSRQPQTDGYRPNASDGFIVVGDKSGARVVAEGLGYPDNIRLNPSGTYLYASETFGRRLTRFPVIAGELGSPEVVAEFTDGTFPNGLEFDEHGAMWVTSIISNRVVSVDPSGEHTIMVEDVGAHHLQAVEEAFSHGELGRHELESAVSSKLQNISGLCFGGPDRRTVYVGSVLGDSVATFRSPVAAPPPHTGMCGRDRPIYRRPSGRVHLSSGRLKRHHPSVRAA